MISRRLIQHYLQQGRIVIEPPPEFIGPNSVDLRLGRKLFQYHPTENRVPMRSLKGEGGIVMAIDPRNPPPLVELEPRANGAWLLEPGQFYIGSTHESTYCRGLVPALNGRSTCGRLSIEVHKTAGLGDNGFRGRWTLEIEATEPVMIRPLDRLLQVSFTPVWSHVDTAHCEMDDVYGGEGHHYQEATAAEGAAPLDY